MTTAVAGALAEMSGARVRLAMKVLKQRMQTKRRSCMSYVQRLGGTGPTCASWAKQ
ncbi:hypothetical protein Pmar_PMAR021136 [Perkinsus marinus ATCC 50983]|uniref:Uncharacterized protein n=1 Tax=Perkinsus marinus (strain ATCC 50983 / TXsc) TaxID=423536 RepID=C5KGI1_PERM5|nr:hypothetical protein Pmar_PMAR021136 [Perkinsus marinus ATCC 50983]EER16537.1 hypothetical protein Pmar_PMAR021136 [Perkinsus marinus ATCC 50983]|eukprot:XP_002784741.1 hypothetical protein Pmar_PMAR021136 [Perkinsus marinus ATCC 50983]